MVQLQLLRPKKTLWHGLFYQSWPLETISTWKPKALFTFSWQATCNSQENVLYHTQPQCPVGGCITFPICGGYWRQSAASSEGVQVSTFSLLCYLQAWFVSVACRCEYIVDYQLLPSTKSVKQVTQYNTTINMYSVYLRNTSTPQNVHMQRI